MIKSIFRISLIAVLILVTQFPLADGVYGGWPARKGDFPPSLGYFKHAELCGGVLISWRHALTAAHCLQDENNNMMYISSTQKFYSATGAWFRFSNVHVHPKFNSWNMRKDLAIVELYGASAERLAGLRVKPVTLKWDSSKIPTGTKLRIMGWGPTSESSDELPKVLHVANAEMDNTFQNWPWWKYWVPTRRSELFFDDESAACCCGDSGSPVVIWNERSNEWNLVGVVGSKEKNKDSACEIGAKWVATSIEDNKDWILGITGGSGKDLCQA